LVAICARAQQTIAMLAADRGEIVERTLKHDGAGLLRSPAAAGRGRHRSDRIDGMVSAIDGRTWRHLPGRGSRQDTNGRDTPTKARPAGCALILELLTENRFQSIWMPPSELCDLRSLLLHCDQWVRMRARAKNALQ